MRPVRPRAATHGGSAQSISRPASRPKHNAKEGGVGKCRQLSAALVGTFQDIRTRHADGDLALLAPRELLALLHALFDAAALRSAAGRDFVSLLEA